MNCIRTCSFCGTKTTLEIDEAGYARFRNGEHVQCVFPELSAGDREVLLSGLCYKCQDAIFVDPAPLCCPYGLRFGVDGGEFAVCTSSCPDHVAECCVTRKCSIPVLKSL